jgi:hypothetical protein
MSDFTPIGDALVRVQVPGEGAVSLRGQYSEVLQAHKRDHRTSDALLSMSWLALKAIERCRQLEEEVDGLRSPDRSDPALPGRDVRAGAAPPRKVRARTAI